MTDNRLPLSFGKRGELTSGQGGDSAWPEYGVIGQPVAHSLSPRLHAAALAHHSIAARYEAIEVAPSDLESFLSCALEAGVRGLNVTLPHKESVLAACDRISEEAAAIGAVNTLVVRDGRWQGHNTDARGLALALEHELGRDLTAALSQVVVIGAGGAARAVVQCMRGLGARAVTVAARRVQSARWADAAGARVVELKHAPLARATMLVQATPLGLQAEDPSPVPATELTGDCFVVDLTYAATPSLLLREARARGCRAQDGLPMLIGQAALAFSLWHGALAPLPVMAEAVGRTW